VTPTLTECLIDRVSQRSDTELCNNEARSWSSARIDALLAGACKVMMCWPGDLGEVELGAGQV
jgi:hypothetical protein